ncbi:MAG: SpoIVB peptidase [Clostridia bacterium]|nr:SpoIVB peptidase [Clostridia bacterium]
MNRKLRIYRKFLIVVCIMMILFLAGMVFYNTANAIPDELMIKAGEDQLNLNVPVVGTIYQRTGSESVSAINFQEMKYPEKHISVNLNSPVTFLTSQTGDYTIDCRLFGVIPVKHVEFYVIDEINLIPAGIPVGIYAETDGVLVIGTGSVNGIDGEEYFPADGMLEKGDYIECINGEPIEKKKELIDGVNQSKGKEILLDIRRNNEKKQIHIMPVQSSESEYQIGVWVRDNIQGIGTLTFVNEDKKFGALGHGINDVDTTELMEVNHGTLYDTDILAIVKGKKGTPGELTGIIDYMEENVLGEITMNTGKGIFGIGNDRLTKSITEPVVPIGFKQEIEIGEAQIVCVMDDQRKEYDIEIKKVDMMPECVNRGISFEVTDQELLDITGGIVQGMSGSPILQNGKIIGAVTHVLVNDPKKGYGIFIENMLEY